MRYRMIAHLSRALLGRVRGGRIRGRGRQACGAGSARPTPSSRRGSGCATASGDALRRGSSWPSARSYAEGLWDCDDLVSLVRIGARELQRLDRLRAPFAPLRNTFTRVPRNTPARAREHAAAHYDLGNELFALFLDETMTYSCGVFDTPRRDAREAQEAKLDMVCRKLELDPRDHLLEIGTGWGSLALHAAGDTDAGSPRRRSRASRRGGPERVREAGLADRVDIQLRGLPRAPRAPLQAGVDRDDRGGRLAVLRHLLRALLASC